MGVQELKKQGNYIEEQLYSVIVNSKGRPDLLAISLYSDIRGWFKINKAGKSKLKNNGYKTSYEELAKKYKRSKELIKQKIVFLESLGLLSRDFRIEYIWGQRQNNVMYLLVWKNTPYFYSEIGIEKTVIYPANLDKKTWDNLNDPFVTSRSSPRVKIEGAPVKKTARAPLESSPIIYSNTTLKTTINNTDLSDICSGEDIILGSESQDLKNQDTHFVFANQPGLEAKPEVSNMSRVDRMIAKEQARRKRDELEGNSFEEVLARAKADRDKERLALAKQQETARTEPPKVIPDQESHKPQEPTPNCELLEVARLELAQVQQAQSDTHIKNGNVYRGNKLLNEFDFTDELIDAVREKSDKPHFPNSRIIAIMRNIVASNPEVRIWGGRQAFINYMVKAVNNEKEFTKEEKAQSLAEMKKKEAEQLLYDFEHRIIRYF